jgi:DNA-binding LacI/PurR family transcriptional regulator
MSNLDKTSSEEIMEKINIIIRQTNYTPEIAKNKLLSLNMDHIKVIKEYHGIAEKKAPAIKSVQQQIYKEIRYHMNDSVKDFNHKQDQKLESDIENNNK